MKAKNKQRHHGENKQRRLDHPYKLKQEDEFDAAVQACGVFVA